MARLGTFSTSETMATQKGESEFPLSPSLDSCQNLGSGTVAPPHLHQIRAQDYPATTESSKQSPSNSDYGFHTVPCSHHHIILCWILSIPANRAANSPTSPTPELLLAVSSFSDSSIIHQILPSFLPNGLAGNYIP